MGRRYASSVHSQKSTTSAKSGRSFLSLTWPSISTNKTNPELPNKNGFMTFDKSRSKHSIWQNIKSWLPASNDAGKNSSTSSLKKFIAKSDSDSIVTKSSAASSSMTSKSRLKQLFTFTTDRKTVSPSSSMHSAANSPESNNKKMDDNKLVDSPSYSTSSLSTIATTTTTTRIVQQRRTGILINNGEDTDEAIAERLKRKHKRREYILKLQHQRRSIQYDPPPFPSSLSIPSTFRHNHDHLTRLNSFSSSSSATEEPIMESSSSDTLLTDDYDNHWSNQRPKPYAATKKATVMFQQKDEEALESEEDGSNGWGFYQPRIMFVEPSPVPRFRNVAPPPPASPPYLSITVPPAMDATAAPAAGNNSIAENKKNAEDSSINTLHPIISIIKSPSTTDDGPIIFTTMKMNDTNSINTMTTTTTTTTMTAASTRKESRKEQCADEEEDDFMDEHDRNISMLIQSLQPTPIEKPVLYFSAPWHRGQRITFSLKNTFPEDHIILFKFMTSTAAANNTIMNKSNVDGTNSSRRNRRQQPSIERYFVRPSAGKMVSSSATDQMNIMLFLNQVPEGFTDSGRGVEGLKTVTKLKDKIIIRWAAIQRNTRIEAWVNSLQESTRRKWIDMLDEEWPDQVTIHMTRIKVRFNT